MSAESCLSELEIHQESRVALEDSPGTEIVSEQSKGVHRIVAVSNLVWMTVAILCLCLFRLGNFDFVLCVEFLRVTILPIL